MLQAGPVTIVVISCDVACDPILGDLTREDIIVRWEELLKSGRALGLIGGPPCETWSAVRWQPVTEGTQRTPPPLRTHKHRRGRPDVTLRQHEQLRIGNLLLLAAHRLLHVCMAVGACGILEHPEEPHWEPRAPSSWRTQTSCAIWAAPVSRLLSFDQCVFGQTNVAPTSLLCVRPPALAAKIQERGRDGRCDHPRRYHQPLRGLDSATNTWRTNPKKRYPWELCPAMAEAIQDHLSHALQECDDTVLDDSELPEGLEAFFQALDPYAATPESLHIARDFMGCRFNQEGVSRDCRFDRPQRPPPKASVPAGPEPCEEHTEEAILQDMESAAASMGLDLGTSALTASRPHARALGTDTGSARGSAISARTTPGRPRGRAILVLSGVNSLFCYLPFSS